MRAPDAVAPRVWFAGPLLDGNFVVYDGESRPAIGVRNATPDQARATIRELKEQGVDFIKIYEMVSPDVFDAMVETAQELDLPIDSHVPLSMGAETAGPRVDSIEHLRNIELDCASNAPELLEERLGLLKNPRRGPWRRAALVTARPSAVAGNRGLRRGALRSGHRRPDVDNPGSHAAHDGTEPGAAVTKPDWNEALSRVPDDVRQGWTALAADISANPDDAYTKFGEWARFLTGRMHQRGVPIGAGTDTPIFLSIPGYSLHAELEQLVASGLSPLEALRAATVRPAEFFGIERRHRYC